MRLPGLGARRLEQIRMRLIDRYARDILRQVIAETGTR
jgi:hypothetical protein